MPDQELRGPVLGAQPVDCCQNVIGVRREVRIGELPLAAPQPSEVEPEHTKPCVSKRSGNPRCRFDVLTAGEAVGEEGKGPRRPSGQVDSSGEFGVLTAGESDSFDSCRHMGNLTLTEAQRSRSPSPHLHPAPTPTPTPTPASTRQVVTRRNDHRYYHARCWLSHSAARTDDRRSCHPGPARSR